jgi:hypothetical protein
MTARFEAGADDVGSVLAVREIYQSSIIGASRHRNSGRSFSFKRRT